MIDVQHVDGEIFEIDVRGHRLFVDQPLRDGGTDTAPTPTELFVSSLAACVAFYARRYLVRHHLPTAGLGARAEYAFASNPTRVGEIVVYLRVPDGVPEDRLAALLAMARHCTVHNTLENPTVTRIELTREESYV